MNKAGLTLLLHDVSKWMKLTPAVRVVLEAEIVGHLPARERAAVIMRYGLDVPPRKKVELATYVGVGKALEPPVTGSRAAQIVKKAIRRLQYQTRAGSLKPHADAILKKASLRGLSLR